MDESEENTASAPLLTYTGQPIIDVGVATIVAFGNRKGPGEITAGDLDAVVAYVTEHFPASPLKSFLTAVYPNSAYVNPTMGADKRQASMIHFLGGYKSTHQRLAASCVFCARPAYETVFRQHVPLSAAEGVINFGPGGRSGLPVCGGCLLASQVFPLGSALWCSGRVLIAHSDNQALTQAFAAAFLHHNRRILDLAGVGEIKNAHPRSIIVHQLLKILEEREWQDGAGSITAYHLTNFGQNADIAIYSLSSPIIAFLRTANGDQYRNAWKTVEARGWVQARAMKQPKRGESSEGRQAGDQSVEEGYGIQRNAVYEDLFSAVEQAGRFVRRHLLRGPLAKGDSDDLDPQRLGRVSWSLTDLFLRRVMGMDKDRREAIRRCGERLAKVIEDNHDSRLLNDLYITRNYGQLRNVLIKASRTELRAEREPIFTFDDFITIFEEGDDLPRVDWSLARDLLYIRLLDALYHSGWFNRHAGEAKQVLEDIAEDENSPDGGRARTA